MLDSCHALCVGYLSSSFKRINARNSIAIPMIAQTIESVQKRNNAPAIKAMPEKIDDDFFIILNI